MSLPKQALYGNKIQSSYARNYQSKIAPQNGRDYSLGETIIINVPTASNIVMSGADTLIKFKINARNATAGPLIAALDRGGAAGVIQRLRVFHGSSLLSDMDNYGNLVASLMSLQNDPMALITKFQVLQGTDLQRGVSMNAAAGATKSIEFSFPLLSILSLTQNYVPLFGMTGSPMRIEIQLVNTIPQFMVSTGVYSADPALKTVTDVELIGNFMEMNDNAMNIIKSASGDVVQWSVSDFKNYASNAVLSGASDTQLSIPIPAKFNSLKSLLHTYREHSSGDATFYPHESCRFALKEYTTRIGSQVLPSTAPNSVAEFYAELLRSVGSVGDLNSQCSIDSDSYDAARPEAFTALTILSKSFFTGMDLESYSNSDIHSIYQGLNTSTHDIFFQPTFGPQTEADGTAVNRNLRVDTYAMFDALILLENGVANVTY
tara:strand:+ start:2829 stop:4127 length:1299 start_codon:yes stop_codon:yes gene_type:complete